MGNEMLDMYLFENGQLLEQLEQTTLEKKDDKFDDADIAEFFRVMHTIKGSSGVMMFDDIMKLAHKLEDVFYFIRENKPDDVPHLELVDNILAVSDFLRAEFDLLQDGEDPSGDSSELIEQLDKFLKKLKKEAEGGETEVVENQQETPKQFYVGPVAKESANHYSVVVYYRNDTEMCNIHAYALMNSMKEFSEELYYQPEDIITNEESAEIILEHGFKMLIKTQGKADDIQNVVDHFDVETCMIDECSPEEFDAGFDAPLKMTEDGNVVINLDSEEKAAEGEAPKEEEKKEEAVQPGDYVIQQKKPGKKNQLAKNKKGKGGGQSFISVSVSKVDSLMDLIGEIVIAESVVLQNPDLQVPGLNLTNFNKSAAQLSKFTSELQDVIMSMRMMPLTNTFQKMNRIVFDASRKVGKEVELKLVGENTEVDKSIIEHISDPLMHMVRNSVDHGIEDAETRKAAGKPAKGQITLEARNEGGKVLLIVADDGAGMDPAKLFAKAKKNGLVPADKRQEDYTEKEILQFITYAGFSTNETVTELSGRGVGMDVVIKNIQTIGGTLEIDSKLGQGSTMTLKIPLTLAIISGILLEVGKAKFVIETNSVKEFINVRDANLVHEPDGDEYVNVRGEYFPVIRLADKYHIDSAVTDVEDGIMILAEYENKNVCIFVDHLIGGQEIVVKPIPSYIKKVDGLSGCTQLGDGSIALIIDVASLIQ